MCEGWREGMRKGESVCVMEGGRVCEGWRERMRKGESVRVMVGVRE